MLQHKHYIGNAHSFEIVNREERPDVAILKTFFVDDTVNANDWQATWEGLKEDAKDLPGVPLVLQEDLEHPKFSVQKFFDRGTIFDFDLDEENHRVIVYVRITDPTIIDRIKSGELEYVSPAVVPRGSEHLKNIGGVDILNRTIPLHLAIVGNPAYGKEKAKMSHLCTGDGKECLHRLKMMTAAKAIYDSSNEDCVSRKIAIIKKERPSISNEQAAAIAYSMCRKGTASHSDGGPSSTGIQSEIDYLTQIPLIRKMMGTTARMASTFDKILNNRDYYIHDGHRGTWITAKNQNVFVAQNQDIATAIKNQCGCNILELTAAGKTDAPPQLKHTKDEAHYRTTSSKTINCVNCLFYHADSNYCEVVKGHITPGHVSDLFQEKN